MSTGRIYKREEMTALLGAECGAVLPPIRVPAELAEIVAGHAQARGESLSAFARRAMVQTVVGDQVIAESIRVRAAGAGELFAPDNGDI